MRLKICALSLAALIALPLSSQVASAASTARILVHFDKHTGAARQKALIERVGGQRVATVQRLGTAVVRVPAAEKKQALSLLRRQPGVTYAEANGTVHASAVSINDPVSLGLPWPLDNPLFPDAWSLTTGDSNVVVAVVDSGVQADHPELLGRVLPGYDFVNNDSDPSDDDGHGTEVAGVIAAQGNNGIGIAGACWKCKIMPVKVLDSSGTGSDIDVASGIVWAVDHGADVINMSLGGTATSQTLADAVSYAERLGVVVVAAAGNDGSTTRATTPNYPAAYPGVISVAGVDETNALYDWSNHGSWIMVGAPGCTYSTTLNGSYGGFCGTSTASPFVAGLAGLARSYNLAATASSVVSTIETTAQAPLGDTAHGLINANAALAGIATAPAGPVASFGASAVSGRLPLSVSFTNSSTSATSYTWSFGDGTSSTDSSPSHTFTAVGSYNVTLVAGDGSSSRLANTTITVAEPLPRATFTMSKGSGRAPFSVRFTNSSSNAASYLWSYGDGSAGSSEASPTHTFAKAGTYTVTLTATGPGGQATATRTITVSRPLPDLVLSLSRTASRKVSGYRLSSFVVRLGNRGGAADRGVKITITLPAGSSFKSVTSAGRSCTRTTHRASCSFGTLSAAKTVKLRFAAIVTTRANVTAIASGKTAEISLTNNAASVKTR
ncbi:MAG TPA: S8 family serine peptidase [Gaiellaceae bacterium]